MAGSKGGRPQKTLTDAQRAEVETLAAVLSTEQMSAYFGMTHDTFTAICEREPDVFRAYKRGKAKAIGKVAQGLIQKALAGDTTSAIFFLKTQGRWAETQKHEVTGADGAPLQIARIERVVVDKPDE